MGGDTVQRRVFLKYPGRSVEEPAGMDRKKVIGYRLCAGEERTQAGVLQKTDLSPASLQAYVTETWLRHTGLPTAKGIRNGS